MNIHKINVFVTAAQYMSFTEAARHLHIAQPSVSHDIAELEKEVGAKLFTRHSKGISLTPQGEIFLVESCKIITILQNTKQKIESMTYEAGVLKFGFISEQMAEPIVPFLEIFKKSHPNVSMTFDAFTSIALTRRIQSNEVDFAFGRRESLMRHKDTDWMHLYKDPFTFIMPKTHPLADNKSLRIHDVANETILLMSSDANPGFYEMVQRLYLSHGITPLINATSNDRMATIMMARIGMGIALLTREFLKLYSFPDMVNINFDEKDAFHNVGIAWDKRITNPIVELFLHDLKAYLKDNPIAI